MSKFRKLIESILFEYSEWEAHEKAIEICKRIVNDLVEIGYPKVWIKHEINSHKIEYALADILTNYPDFKIPEKFTSLNDLTAFYKEVSNTSKELATNGKCIFLFGDDRYNKIVPEIEKYHNQFNDLYQKFNKEINDEDVDSEGTTIENPEEVKKFMQGSVAVDKAGRPLALYVGTETQVDKQFDFKHKRNDSYSKQNAIFTTRRKDIADEYRNYVKDGKYQRNPNTLSKVYVNLKNPVIADFKGALFRGINTGYNGYMYTGYTDDDEDWINVTDMQGNYLQSFSGSAKVPAMNQIVSFAKKNGYDGIIAKNVDDFRRDPKYSEVVYSDLPYGNDEYIVFNPKQVMIVNQE